MTGSFAFGKGETITEGFIVFPIAALKINPHRSFSPVWLARVDSVRLPAAWATRIHVHEVRCLVVSDATAFHGECRVAQGAGLDAFETNVDRLAQNMLAALGDPAVLASAAKHFVGFRRAIGRHDLVCAITIERLSNVIDQIEELRVHLSLVTGSEVEQKIIDLFERRGDVGTITCIDDVQSLASMGMIERQLSLVIYQVSLAHAAKRYKEQAQHDRGNIAFVS